MYKILTGDQVIYDSANKDDYPVTGPGLDPELSQAGSLEFTLLKGHPLLEQMQEMQTFVTAYQDDDCLFYGRVLTADEDLYGGLQVYCEGALTFLLDSELEPVTVTETIAAFFRRCVESHNSQVEANKQFEVGEVTHEKASTEMEFKIESYITTQNALTSSLTGKHGGFLRVRLEGGKRYLDYIQENTHVNSQPIKVGENIIDKQKHVSGENAFSILRPLGKNKLTIEGASSKNLFSSASLVSGKKLTAKDTETIVDAEDWCYSPAYIPVTPGATYIFGPAQCRINFYDSAKKCVGTFFTGDEDPDSAAEEAGSNEVTAPAKAAFARMSYPTVYKDRAVFKTPGQNLIGGYVRGEVLGSLFLKEIATQSDRWCHTEMVSVTPGATYLATPGSVYLNYYEPIEDEDGNPTGEMKVTDTFTPVNDLGGDYITIPSGISLVKISFPSRYTATQRFELASGNLASRSGQVTGKQLNYEMGEEIDDDAGWGYTSAYIDVKEDSPYTGSPTPFRMSFYDSKKKLLSGEESESGKTLAWVTSPHDAKYARVSIPLSSQNEFLLQQGKSLIRTHLDAGNKVIELPDRIAKWGHIIHTENFPDIEDAQTLYNAAMDFLNRRVAELPKTCEISLIDLHLLNPEIERIDLGDVFNDIEGFDGPMVAAALHKDLEDPKNDTVTFKNVSELAINDAGSSSGSISSAYASSSRSEGYKYKSIREELDEEDSSISKLFLISSRNIELHALEDLWLGTAGKLTLLAKGDDGTYGRITMDSGMIHLAAENIIHNAHNIYNIADNVVTIADNVYTHANLIWNEAKDIVTIADNIYTVADNVVTIADNVFTHANLIYNQAQDIINNAHNIYNIADNVVTIADNVYTHANLIWNEAKDIVTIADNIYTVADNVVTIADNVFTHANLIYNQAQDIINNAHNIYNIADNVVTIADNVYTHANLIWNEAKDIVTIADNIYTVADNVVTIADNVFTHANLIYNQAQDIINNAHNIYNIADNVVTIADNVYTHANLIWNEAKDIVTIADNIYTLADNIVTIADTIYTQANTMTFVAGNVDTVDGTIKKIFGSAIHATAAQLAFANGIITIDQNGVLHIAEGSGLKLSKNGTEYGVFTEDMLTAGLIVSKITGDDSSTDYRVKLGTFVDDYLDAGVLVTKITGDNSNSTIGVKLGTFVDDYLDAGVVVSKITGDNSNSSIGVKLGTFVDDYLDAGVIVSKITGDNSNASMAVKLGTFVDDQLDAGVLITKITDSNVGSSYQTAFGTYINGKIDAGTVVSKITGDNSNSSIGVKLGTFVDDYLDAGVIVSKITGSTSVSMGTYINNQLDAGVMVSKITGDNSNSTIGVKLGTFVDDYLDAGVVVSKITGSSSVTMGTYINNQLDAGVMVSKITGDNSNSSIGVKLGTFIDDYLDAGVVVSKVTGSTTVSMGTYINNQLDAGVMVEKITGKTLGTKTALRLLGDEIDLRGNTTIQGFLDVRGTVSAPEFVLKSGVKIGSTGGDISLSTAIQTITIDSSAGTLTYTTIGGTSTTVNFNSAAAALSQVTISNGTWDSGSKTILALDGDGNTLVTVVETIPTPTDYTDVKLTDTLYGTSFYVGGKPFSHNVDTSGSYTAGQTNGASGVDFYSESVWTDGSKTITLDNSKTKTVSIPSTATWSSAKTADKQYSVTAIVGGRSLTSTIDTTGSYNAGAASVTQRSVSSLSKVTLGSSDTGSSVSKSTTVTYTDGNTVSKSIVIDASSVYSAGQTNGASNVGFYSTGVWSNGSRTITLTNSETTSVSIPSTGTWSSAKTADKQYSVTVIVGGRSLTSTIDTTGSYNAGAASVTQRSVSSLSKVTLGSSDTGSSVSKSTTVTYSDNTTVSKTIVIDASNVYLKGKSDGAEIGNARYSEGWIDGYNAAVGVSGKSGDTITIPTTTSTYNSTPSRSYTANVRVNDTHYISFPSSVSLVPGQTFNGAAGNYVYKNSVSLEGTSVGAVYWT